MSLQSFGDDVVSSIRRIRRHPRNPLILVFMLAVAVGSMMGIFDLAYRALHDGLPYEHPERIVVAGDKVSSFLVSGYNWQPNPFANTIFDRLAEFHLETAELDSASGSKRLLIACITPQFFSVLGVRMELGSDLPDAPAPSPQSVISWLPIVISHNTWRTYFDSDQRIVGREISLKLLSPYHFQVVGVAPPGVRFPTGVDAWVPEHLVSSSMIQTAAPPNWSNATVGRLRPDISVAVAETAIRSWPQKNQMWVWNNTAQLISLRQFLVGEFYNLGPLLWLAAIFFLALTIAAVASIFHLEYEERREEFRIRRILGATPRRLFRTLNIETILILSLALALSFLVRYALTRFTLTYLHLPFELRVGSTGIDVILAFGTAGAVAALIGIGQGRGLQAFAFFNKLRDNTDSGAYQSPAVLKFHFPLQVVPATIILIAAILLVRGAYTLIRTDPGLKPAGVFVCEAALPYNQEQYMFSGIDRNLPPKERDQQAKARLEQFRRQMSSYFSLIIRQIKGHAGVTDAGVLSIAPYSGYPAGTQGIYVSRTLERPSSTVMITAHLVSMSSGAVPALGMKLLYGRNFTGELDDLADQDTVVINEALAERIGPGAASLSQFIIPQAQGPVPARIVGIVQNVHDTDLFTPAEPTVYYPLSQYGISDVDIVFRMSRSMPFQDAYSLLRSSVRSVVPGAITTRFESMDDMVQSAGTLTRYCSYFLSALAVLGVFVAGICAWVRSIAEVRRRQHEIGIRLALGAEAGRIVRLIVGGQAKSSLLAACIGAVIAWWFSRLVSYLLNGVNASGISNYVFGIATITTFVSLISIWAVRKRIRQNPRDLIGKQSF